MPSSRPKPDCLKPPNGRRHAHRAVRVDGEDAGVDARARRAARARRRASRSSPRARTACRWRGGSPPPRPSNGMTAATGPKTSSRATRSSFDASTSVHGNQKPGPVRGLAPEERLAVDERRHRLAVRRRDQRAHLGRLVGRVADLHAAGRVDEQLEEAVVGGALDEDPRARAAVLAGVVEDGVGRGRGGLLQVGVREDDVRRLAAELERDALDRPGRALHHRRARPRSSR